MSDKRFRIAFSFAGEKRDFVAEVAALLAKQFGEEAILYDKFHELAALAQDRKDWPQAEKLARQALPLSEKVGRLELIASNCQRIAKVWCGRANPQKLCFTPNARWKSSPGSAFPQTSKPPARFCGNANPSPSGLSEDVLFAFDDHAGFALFDLGDQVADFRFGGMSGLPKSAQNQFQIKARNPIGLTVIAGTSVIGKQFTAACSAQSNAFSFTGIKRGR